MPNIIICYDEYLVIELRFLIMWFAYILYKIKLN